MANNSFILASVLAGFYQAFLSEITVFFFLGTFQSTTHVFCQTPDLGQGLEFDFTFANNNENNNDNENNPHLNFPGWDGTRGLKFGTQT